MRTLLPPALASLVLASGPLLGVTAADYSGCAGTVALRTRAATPASYEAILADLVPGDLVQLGPGVYADGLTLADVHGSEDSCIVIEGPETGPAAVFPGRPCCNTVSLTDSSYLVIRNLELAGGGEEVDAVKAESPSESVHHLTLENLTIHGHGAGQQIVGISSKCPAWNWVVRRNVIEGAGTGMYFGNSDGSADFSHSLIEHNFVRDTLGYNAQIKHQLARSTGVGAPVTGTTIVRHNVFVKETSVVTPDGPRPNLLVGHWPLTGAGAMDRYEIYGNFFYQNASGIEPLFQGTGNLAFYANLLVNDFGNGAQIQFHEAGSPRKIDLFGNTVLASGTGLSITGADPGFTQLVVGNAVFAATPLAGGAQSENTTAARASAPSYLTSPDDPPGAGLDLTPDLTADPTTVAGAVDRSPFASFDDFDRDFDGRVPGAVRGAYAGGPPFWVLALERKPDGPILADGFESGDTAAWSAAVP